MEPAYWQTALEHLSKADPDLEPLLIRYRRDVLRPRGRLFASLLNAIVGQQISVAAASAIWRRFEEAFPGLPPEAIASLEAEELRALGLSRKKAEYSIGIARYFREIGAEGLERLASMEDDKIMAELQSLKGVGPWTAQMVLIFALGRPDVLPLGDLALLRAAQQTFSWADQSDTKALQALLAERGERWKPYRSVASWYLWRLLDAEPVQY